MDFLKILAILDGICLLQNSFSNGSVFEIRRSENPHFCFLEYRDGKYTVGKDKYATQFKPTNFWKLPIKEQLLYLRKEIKECGVEDEISKHFRPCGIATFSSSLRDLEYFKPYSKEIEKNFEHHVYLRLTEFIRENDLPPVSEDEFIKSLTITANLEDDGTDVFAESPLLFHFGDYLCPKYRYLERTSTFETSPSDFRDWIAEREIDTLSKKHKRRLSL